MSLAYSYGKAASFGVVGLTDDTKNMVLDMHDRGYVGCVYDANHEKVKDFLENEANSTKILGAKSLEEMIENLKVPKLIALFLEGTAIDNFIEDELVPLMSYKDYIIDVGSSGREVSTKRVKDLRRKGIRYIGSKDGASASLLQGICIGLKHQDYQSWYFGDDDLASDSTGKEETHEEYEAKFCCTRGIPDRREFCISTVIGEISHQDQHLKFETKHLLKSLSPPSQTSEINDEWNEEKLQAKKRRRSESTPLSEDQKTFIDHLAKAAYACKIMIYAEGYALIKEIDDMHQWSLDYAALNPSLPHNYINQCEFFGKIKAAFTKNPQLTNLLLDEDFAKAVNEGLPSIKEVIAKAATLGVSVDIISGALEYYENYTAKKLLCAKLLETRRDDEEAMEVAEFDLSPLTKYQNQLKMVQSQLEKVKKIVGKMLEIEAQDPSAFDDARRTLNPNFRVDMTTTQTALMRINMTFGSNYKACMKHLEKDEKVTPLLIDIIQKKYSDTLDFLNHCPSESVKRRVFKLVNL